MIEMKRSRPLLVSLAAFAAVAATTSTGRASLQPPEKVEAPRFELPDEGASFPLKSTRHAVEVVGPVAHVEITQTYVNTGSKLLDATYVFPGSPRSAVASLVMKIGERTVRAELKEREEARKTFEKAKQEGFRASLLEQDRPNVFRMGLTNVRPGETVEVTLGYTELLVPEEGFYELTLPAVVAPRFGGEAEGLGERPSLAPQEGLPAWTADLRLADGLGITEVRSPTHDISPKVDPQGRVKVEVSTDGDAELVVRWRLATGLRPDAGLTLYEGPDESFFMMTVAPPKRVARDQIPAREIAFVLDVSCSMRGYPLDVAKTVMKESLQKLRPSDRFNVLFFAGSGWALSSAPLRATRENVERALREVSKQQGGGGTQLVDALSAVAELPRAEGLARSIVVVTDGLVGFEKAAFAKVRERLEDSTLFTLGIGNNVNRMLVEGLARAGGGTSHVAHDQDGARAEAERLVQAMGAPVLTDLELEIEGLEAYDLEPPSLPDLYADRPVVVVGKYRGEPQGVLRFSAHAADRSLVRELRPGEARASEANAALRALWARRRLQRIADDRSLGGAGGEAATKAQLDARITALGLKYGLLTEHTAFVAVDSEGGRAQGAKTSVVQPAPHPKGMAKGNAMGLGGLGVRSMQLQGARGYGRGGGGFASTGAPAPRRSMRQAAPAAEPERSQPAPAADAAEREEAPAKKKDSPALRSRVGVPLVTKGDFDAPVARLVLERALRRLSPELQKRGATGRVVLELDVDADGRVTSVRVIDGGLREPTGQAKLVEQLGELRLPQKAVKTPGTLRVSFELR